MLILDTNVLSELMRPRPNAGVMDRLNAATPGSLHATAISEAELRVGAALLPEGARKRRLIEKIDILIFRELRDRVIPFDGAAARSFADIVAVRRAAGRPIALADAQIAAIAVSRDGTLATRNVKDFDGCGVALADPWAD